MIFSRESQILIQTKSEKHSPSNQSNTSNSLMGFLLGLSSSLLLISLNMPAGKRHSCRKMTAQASVMQYFDRECNRLRNPKDAAHQEKYFKHVHPFYGIRSPALRQMVRKVQAQHQTEWTSTTLLDTAEALLEAAHGEKKLLGVYLLGVPSNLKRIQEEPQVIEKLGGFIESHVNDWATCDGLSSQVVRNLIASNSDYAPEVQSWCRSSNDWKQRASCISFVPLARHGEYNGVILDIATNVIKNSERFPQLGVGWVLRNLSMADEAAVVAFIKEHYSEFTREGLRYAIEKMNEPLRQELLNYDK